MGGKYLWGVSTYGGKKQTRSVGPFTADLAHDSCYFCYNCYNCYKLRCLVGSFADSEHVNIKANTNTIKL
jgi:hypothetical protein